MTKADESAPISARAASTALLNAGLVTGYRQALEQCAAKLRGQGQAWTDEALAAAEAAGSPVAFLRARIVLAEARRWQARLERLAGVIEAEHKGRATEETAARSAAEALTAAVDAELSRARAATTKRSSPRSLLARIFPPSG